jgi:hypothetical protein
MCSTSALTVPTCHCRPYPLLPMGCHRGQPLFRLLAPRSPASALLCVAVAAEKRLHADRHLRPWNRLADATASTACAPNFSPSHEPGATTTGRHSPCRSPPATCPLPWSTFYVELFPAPTPKLAPPLAGLVLDMFPHRLGRRVTGIDRSCRLPASWQRLPYPSSGLPAHSRLGRPEAAQVHSKFLQFPIELI